MIKTEFAFLAGDVVRSLRGRDVGRLLVVLALLPDGRLSVADGSVRKREAPKKKKSKHVQWVARPKGALFTKLGNGESVTNGEIRRALSAMEQS